jgi:DNA-binding transcriptional regulator LsrR (DeoR family)
MMSDGSATPYNAVIRMADQIGARHYPHPLPVLAKDAEELRILHGQEPVRNTMALCAEADFSLVGIGQLSRRASLMVDGFLSETELTLLLAAGAAGEITSWIYDSTCHLMDGDFNTRVASAPIPRATDRPVTAVAIGEAKVGAIRAALRGHLINGLITNETTAERLLAAGAGAIAGP